jgi:hypothetical protein
MLGLGLAITEISTMFQEQDAVILLYAPEWDYVDEAVTSTYFDEALQGSYVPEFNYVDESGSNIYSTEG